MKYINNLVAILALQLTLQTVAVSAHAAKIQFPTEELATESVLPKFDNPVPVRNRNVETAGHVELTGFYGWTLNDAFAKAQSYGGIFSYHFNEFHALQIFAAKLSGQQNSYPEQIKSETGLDIRNKAAVPKGTYLLAYQVTPFYGKLSVTKQGVVNMSIYGTLGVGPYQLMDQNTFAISPGLGTKFYFSPKFSVRADYRFFFYNARDPIDPNFGKRAQINSILSIGIGYIL